MQPPLLPPPPTAQPYSLTATNETLPQPQSTTASPIAVEVIHDTCTAHDGVIGDVDESQDAIKPIRMNQPILKQSSVSLEAKGKRSRGPTPRKVQFVIPEKAFGGRGQTEFIRCPSRKSHTRRPLPLGTFDTDSDSQSQGTLSDVSDVSEPHFDLLNNLFSQKFCQNSRLIKCVRKKKKRKEKEQQWLSMISPDLGLHNAQKTFSRIKAANSHLNMNVAASSVHMAAGGNGAGAKLAGANSNQRRALAVDGKRDRFKSPSMSMSRGRRAWHKAQKQMKHTQNNAAYPSSAEIVHGTPVVQKVSKIADLKMKQQQQQGHQQQQSSILPLKLPLLEKIDLPLPSHEFKVIDDDDEHGTDGDHEDNSEDLFAVSNCNAGSIPLECIAVAVAVADSTTAERVPPRPEATTVEMKDNSQENSPKQVECGRLSDEMKSEPLLVQQSPQSTTNATDTGMQTQTSNATGKHLLTISYERFEEEEDDDLVLQKVRDTDTDIANPASKTDADADGDRHSSNQMDQSEPLFVPTSQEDVVVDEDGDVQVATSTADAIRDNNTERTQTASATAQQADATANTTSSVEQRQQTDDRDQATNAVHATLATAAVPDMTRISFAPMSFARSIGTQTEGAQCEIGIQCNMDQLYHAMPLPRHSEPLLPASGTPLVIETSFGTRFQRMESYTDNAGANNNNSNEVAPAAEQKQTEPPNNGAVDAATTNDVSLRLFAAKIAATAEQALAELSPIVEAANDERVQPEAIRLQSLTLSIQSTANDAEHTNPNHINVKNVPEKNTRKRTFADCMARDVIDVDEDDDDDVDLVACDVASQTVPKRRKLNDCEETNQNERTASSTSDADRTKYQKMEFVWVRYADQLVPSLILDCFYEEHELFYPERYLLLWIPYIDSEGDREGKTSISEASHTEVALRITEQQIADLVKNNIIPKAAWNELQQYKPELYHKHFDSLGRRRPTKNKKAKQKRRASVM